MAEVVLSTTVDLSLIKMKWREQYVSEGLNRKVVPSQPPGVYQGLRMIQNIVSTRQVELSPDADSNHHMAVYQSTTGFSMTYWDRAGTAIILDLSDAALDSTDVVIAMEMDYQIGVDTTANWMAFPLTDYLAMAATRRDELVVLGTIAVPAAATNITTAMISMDRRTMSWMGLSKGAISWSPVIRNGDFEQADNGTSNVWFWSLLTVAGSGTGTVLVDGTDPSRNSFALEMANLTSGSVTFLAIQNIGIPVTPGQLGIVRLQKKNLVIPSSGTISATLNFSDNTGADAATVVVDIDLTGVDGSYQEVMSTFEVPAGVTMLSRIQVGGTPTYAAAPADVLYIDDVNVWLETQGDRSDLQHGAVGDLEVMGRLSIREPAAPYSNDSVEVIYNSTSNRLDIDDQAGSGNLILHHKGELDVDKNVSSIGSALLGAIADADVGRVIAPASVFAGVEYTLMWESVPSGQPGYRLYVSSAGTSIRTFNASYDNTTNLWTQDTTTDDTQATYEDASGITVKRKFLNSSDWLETAWDVVRVVVDHLGYRTGRVSEIREEWLDDAADPPGWVSATSGAGSVTIGTSTVIESAAVDMATTAASASTSMTTKQTLAFPSSDKVWVIEAEVYFDNVSGVGGSMGFLRATGSTSGAYFSYIPSASAFWRLYTFNHGNIGTPTIVATTISPVANTPQRLRLEMYGSAIPGGAKVLAYIDGVLEATSTTKQPDNPMDILFSSFDDGAGAARSMLVGPFAAWYNRVLKDDAL